MRKIRVLVTGAGGPAGMGTIKSLMQDNGIEVVAADMNPLAAGLYWTHFRALVPPASAKDYVEKMLATVKKHKVDVLFPTVDEEIGILAEHSHKFEQYTKLLISPLNSVRACTDKWATYETLTGLKIPVVRTERINTEKALHPAARRLGFPLAIKPMVSRGGRGLFHCKTKNELESNYRQLKSMLPFHDTYYDEDASRMIICQEHLPGIEYDNVALRGDSGPVVANVPMKAKEWDVKTQHRTIITEHNKRAMDLAGTIMNRLDLRGPIDIEMREDKGGVLKALDVNPRVGGDVELATAAGCNIPLLTVKLAMGERVDYSDFNDDMILIRYLGIQTMKKSQIPV